MKQIYENLWKSMKIHGIHEHVWDISVLEKEDYLFSIFYKNQRLTYLSSKKKPCLNRDTNKSRFSGKH